MSRDLYQEDIKALAQTGIATESLDHPDRKITVDNPLCGDRVAMEVCLENGRVAALAHQVKGCLLCRASANAVARSAIGASEQDVLNAEQELRAFLKKERSDGQIPGWESLALFAPVRDHKSRHECVLLPLKALKQLLVPSKE